MRIDYSNQDISLLVINYSKRIDEICNVYEQEIERLKCENEILRNRKGVSHTIRLKKYFMNIISLIKFILNYFGLLELVQKMYIYKELKRIFHNLIEG